MILPCAAGESDGGRRNRCPVALAAGLLVAACALVQLTTARPLVEDQHPTTTTIGGQANEHNERVLASLNESFAKFLQAGERQQQSERLGADGQATTTTTRANNNNNNNNKQQQQQIVALKKISCDKLSLVVMAQRAINSSTSSGALQRLAECREENLLDLELVEMFERSTGQLKTTQMVGQSDSNQTESNNNNSSNNQTSRTSNKQRDRETVRQTHECGRQHDHQSAGCNSSASQSMPLDRQQQQQPEVANSSPLHLGARLAIVLVGAGVTLVGLATFVDSQSSEDNSPNNGDANNDAGSLRRCQGGGNRAKTNQREANARGRFFLDLGPQVPKLRDYRSLSISSNCSSNLFCSTNSVASSSAPILANSNQLHGFASNLHHHYQPTSGQLTVPVCANQYESNLELHLNQSCDQRQSSSLDQPVASFEQRGRSKEINATKPESDSLARQILLAFSLHRTAGQIFAQQPPAKHHNRHQPESVDWLHGLRFFSMIWVIVIHSYNFALRWMFFSNTSTLDGIYKSVASQFIANGSFACDSFFFVGGFLLPYLALKPSSRDRDCEDDDEFTRHALGQQQQRKHKQQVAAPVREHDQHDEGQEEEDEDEEEEEELSETTAQSASTTPIGDTCRTSGCYWRTCTNLTGTCRQTQQQQAAGFPQVSSLCVLAESPASGGACCRSPSPCTCQLCQSCRPSTPGLAAHQEEGLLDHRRTSQTVTQTTETLNNPTEQNNNSQRKRRLAPNTNELGCSAAQLKTPNKPILANSQQARHFTATEDLSTFERSGSRSSSRTPTVTLSATRKQQQQKQKQKQQAKRRLHSKASSKPNSDQFTWQQCSANVLRRYVRMMPLMMAIIGLCTSLLRYLGDGPVWQESTMMYDHWCRRNWWVNAMFLHNFVNRENMCLSHSWYSAVDFQLFLVGQLVLFVLCRSRRIGLLLLVSLLFASPLVTMILTIRHHLPAVPLISSVDEQTMNLYYGEVYIKPYSRASPYLIGILLAYLMRTTNLGQWRLRRWQIITGWTLAICLLLAIIVAMQPAMNGYTPGKLESALYSGWSRPLWACAAGWIIFACITKQAGPIGRLLGARCFVPLSRLTYPAFLVHPIIMASFYGTRQASFQFSHYLMLYLILGNIVITYASAFVLAVLVELPFLSIERVISRRLFGNKTTPTAQ